jgi:hypothetical protein
MNHVFMEGLSGAGIIGGLVCGSVVVLVLVFLAFKMSRYRNAPSPDFSFNDFSLMRYQPMTRLLSSQDLEFLAAQPGCRPETLARLRRDRRRIFRMYLRDLVADFQALHAAARKMAASSPEPQAQLIASLLRQQVTFWFALLSIETRLLLPQAGGLDIGELIASVEALRLDVARMAA